MEKELALAYLDFSKVNEESFQRQACLLHTNNPNSHIYWRKLKFEEGRQKKNECI